MEIIDSDPLLKVESAMIDNTLYHLWVDDKGREELNFAGYDMGNRVYIVKHLDEKHFIAKVPACRVLCGARGCGMVFPFGTKYYLARISDEKLPADWNAWTGRVSLTHEIRGGRQWKLAIAILEEIWKGEKEWVISVAGYGEYFFLGNEDDAERERSRKAMWEQSVGRKRLADEEEIKSRVINKCQNHPNFNTKTKYHCNCEKCK